MGTSSTIKFISKCGNKIDVYVVIYQHSDGHLNNVGSKLVNFIKSKKMVNGITNRETQFNGFGCLIAQYIKLLKKSAGDIYIKPIDTNNYATYNYILTYYEDYNKFTIGVDCIDDGKEFSIDDYENVIEEYSRKMNEEE